MSGSNLHRRLASSLSATTLACCLVALPLSGAHAQTVDGVTVQQLQQELARRDAIIIDLESRVRALEASRGPAPSAGPQIAPGPASVAAPQPQGPVAARGGAGAGLEVDEIAAERALERSLVQQGASLLPPGRAELNAAFAYAPSHRSFPILLSTNQGVFLGARAETRDLFDWSLGLDVGLPFDAQFEIAVPYRLVTQKMTDSIGGVPQFEGRTSGSGVGDLQVGLAKTLFSSQSAQSKLIARVTWIAGTGAESDNGVFLDQGNSTVVGQLSATWRRDPVVFLASGSYGHFFRNGNIRRGDFVDLSLGAAVALSPESALTFSLDQSYSNALQIGGIRQTGSELQSSMFNATASTIVGPDILLSVKAGVGLTPDAPDYQFGVGVSVPLRFGAK